MLNPVWVPIIIFSSVPIMVIGFPIARAFARCMEQAPPPQGIPHEVSARLERMEQALDTIAVEVERISEGQRFTTKLLSGRAESGPGATEQPS
jgi:hypothetical protein